MIPCKTCCHWKILESQKRYCFINFKPNFIPHLCKMIQLFMIKSKKSIYFPIFHNDV